MAKANHEGDNDNLVDSKQVEALVLERISILEELRIRLSLSNPQDTTIEVEARINGVIYSLIQDQINTLKNLLKNIREL